MNQLTHLDENGAARMVDVSEKTDTVREAMAAGSIRMSAECFALVKNGAVKKGDVLSVARIAGIMGAKKTFELVPLCHCIGLTGVELEFLMHEENCEIEAHCRTKTVGKTGVEMEALTGVQIALLTIYDMCKAIDRGMVMTDIRLLKKSGGKSGIWEG
ncbi:MAG: cyclic pyranopterin monophosphate synthase MoaC [Lachnospiraceae bacterium]|nr:cyclic pyranopterin monophosphate synthase MoaC [Lachnospiraceae bacterium]